MDVINYVGKLSSVRTLEIAVTFVNRSRLFFTEE